MFEDLGLAITDPVKRLQALEGRWKALYRVIEERAQWPEFADQPGWKTGLLVHHYKQFGRQGIVHEFEVDTGTLSELRNLEEAARRECGQGSDGPNSSAQASVNVVVCSVTERDQVIAAREELKITKHTLQPSSLKLTD